MSKRSPPKQLPLLDWQKDSVVERFDDAAVQAVSVRGSISRGVAATLDQCELQRETIAQKMTEFLGEDVAAHSISVYASQAREDQTISALRLMALIHATGDVRVLQLLAEPLGYIVVEKRYEAAIDEARYQDAIEELTQRKQLARRSWKTPRK